jgi:hypothetical protein
MDRFDNVFVQTFGKTKGQNYFNKLLCPIDGPSE